MILCSHALVGAAVASTIPSHPAAALLIGFASHFILDAIPHADYPIRSRSVNPEIGAPMVLDAAFSGTSDHWFRWTVGHPGRRLSIRIPESLSAVLLGAMEDAPDPLQFVYAHFPREPLWTLQRFHRWAHTDKQIQDLALAFGTQAAFVAVIIGIATAANRGVFTPAFAMVH
jgi:hypothetical protein